MLHSDYLPVIEAQVQCINEQLVGVKKERLAFSHTDKHFQIEKHNTKDTLENSTVLFRGQGRACHLFLNGYQAFFFTE